MRPSVEVEGARVFLGDCRDVLKTLPDNSVDSVVTDPPYELGFMGKSWDSSGIAYDVTVWEECLRVLKPGGHILAFGGTRTWHRLAVAIEDAGFEIRDNIAWIYGSGFPKSLDVSKAIDKKAGAEREVIGQRTGVVKGTGGRYNWHTDESDTGPTTVNDTLPATPEAKTWQGWGTALKPAFEPVVVGRKPLVGTVAENVLAWGVGGLNIDGSRIGTTVESWPSSRSYGGGTEYSFTNTSKGPEYAQKTGPAPQGRWPANVVLDEFTAGLLDEQSGVSKSPEGIITQGGTSTRGFDVGGGSGERAGRFQGHGDTGGASRFFYQAKASKRDRNEGLEELESVKGGSMNGAEYREGKPTNHPMRQNFHPTVKPTQLMRYLIKLVTPEGGTVLDPFTGSGSTGKAALLDGYEFIGAELTEEYLPIIEGRLRWALENRDEETLF